MFNCHFLDHEPQIPGRKVPQLRKYRIDVCLIDSEPSCECSRVLIDRRCRYPSAAGIGIVGATQLESRKNCAVGATHTIEVAADDRSTHDEVMIAPCVVGSDGARRSRRLQSATKIRQGESDDLRFDPQLNGGIVERFHRVTDLRQQCGLRVHLALVRIKASQGTEKNLTS